MRLANGSLAAFSPVALTEEVKSRVAAFGTVKYLIAPDLEHHIFLDPWQKEYPNAILIGPDELSAKRDKAGQPLTFTQLWKKDVPPMVDAEFDKEFEYTYVAAHPNKELVFNHKPTKTLIQADFMFNLPATEQMSKTGIDPTAGFLTRLFIKLNSPDASPNAVWQRRFLWYGMSSSDRNGFNKSARIVDGWDFTRMIPCHGDVIEGNAKEVFRKVFAWHLADQ